MYASLRKMIFSYKTLETSTPGKFCLKILIHAYSAEHSLSEDDNVGYSYEDQIFSLNTKKKKNEINGQVLEIFFLLVLQFSLKQLKYFYKFLMSQKFVGSIYNIYI